MILREVVRVEEGMELALDVSGKKFENRRRLLSCSFFGDSDVRWRYVENFSPRYVLYKVRMVRM
jgi:hypothetical protein